MKFVVRFQSVLLVVLVGCAKTVGDARAEPGSMRSPQRIVAGSVLAAEVLLEIAPRRRIAAVHELAVDPRYSLVADLAGDFTLVGAEPEDLLSVAPDLVIVDAFTRPETLAILASAGVPVLRTTTPRRFVDIADNIRAIGRACDLQAAAESLVVGMQQRLTELADKGRDLAGWRVMSLDGALHTYGSGSLFDAVVTAAGACNLAAENGAGPFRKLDLESALAWRPEVLVIDMVSGSEDSESAWMRQRTGFEFLPAMANGRIVFVPSNLFGTTSHRLVETVAFVQDALLRWGPR